MLDPNLKFTPGKISESMQALNTLAIHCHKVNVEAGWWTDTKYDSKIESLKNVGMDESTAIATLKALGIERSTLKTRDVGNLLCLVHSEISEAMEGARKNLLDDKLPHRKMFEVELADALIRIFDIAGAFGLDLGGAVEEKMAYNANREDHKMENRMKENGKKF